MGTGIGKKQTFVQGAAIIAIAHITIKAIGALFKIPLERMILGTEGMGIYNASYTIYNWLFMISTAGLPVAVSKMVAESSAVGNFAEAQKIFKISRRLLFAVGVVGSLALFFGARFFANALGAPSAEYTIMAMAPSLFFVSIMSSYRGFFQGLNNMTPTAISEVAEALGKLLIGLTLGFILIPLGVAYGAAGAIGGVTMGTAVSLLYLLGYYLFQRRKIKAEVFRAKMPVKSGWVLLRQLIKIAIPVTLGVSVFTLTTLIDTAMVMNQLKYLGYTESQRLSMNGYLGHAVTMFNVAPTIISAIAVSIVPSIASSLSIGNLSQAKNNTKSALRLTIILGFPCAVGLCALAVPILKFVYDDSNYSFLLNVMGLAVALVTLVQVGNAILQANGRVWVPVNNMAIGGAVKIIVNLVLVSRPEININGAPVGTFLCYFTVMALNLRAIKMVSGIKYEFSDFVFKPGISALIMGVMAVLSYDFLHNLVPSNIVSLLGAIAIAGGIYLIMLLLIGGLKKEDILLMPKGKKIADFMYKFRLIR